ncbi:MAG: SURF1 family protein [Ramlibacter sp.]
MHAEPPRPRSAALLVLLLALGAAVAAGFIALGAWQVERLGWKQALIARVDQRLAAAPVPAPDAAHAAGLTHESAEYLRVQARGRFDFSRQTLVRATTDLGAGYWVLAPLQRDDGSWVLVNRGFIPPELRDQVPAGDATQEVVGLLRLSEPGGSLLQRNDPAQGRWYSRDVADIAAARHLQGPVAPYFIDAQAASPATGWPRAGLTVVRFSNNHLGYALTWFALAAGTVAAMGYLVLDDRRQRRLAGTSALADRRP